MGYWKERQIEEMQRGWSSPGNKSVCAACFEDYALREFITEHASDAECSYCGRRSEQAIAVSIDGVIEHVKARLASEWGDADSEGVPYDSSEGGYQMATVLDTYDLLFDQEDVGARGEQLRQDLLGAFHTGQWVRRNWQQLTPQERLRYSWESFVEYIQMQRRYLFSLAEPDEDEEMISPAAMLDTVGDLVREAGLVRVLPAGTGIWRGRPHAPGEFYEAAGDLATPPRHCATQANRMSPAGIPMFYGALDQRTPVYEVSGPGCPPMVTVARFVATRPLHVIDLSAVPTMPSLYDVDQRHLRAAVGFLRGFASDLSKPIERNGREHIEYVPTQIVTEYFRHVFRDENRLQVKGLLYRSTRCSGGVACVLFFENEECGGPQVSWRPKDCWLQLEPLSIERIQMDVTEGCSPAAERRGEASNSGAASGASLS